MIRRISALAVLVFAAAGCSFGPRASEERPASVTRAGAAREEDRLSPAEAVAAEPGPGTMPGEAEGPPPAEPAEAPEPYVRQLTTQFAPYALSIGDVIEVNVWNEPELKTRTEVNEEGTVVLPLIGVVKAYDLSPSELEEEVRRQYADGYLVHPQVSVSVVERRGREAYVLGAVRSPGIYPLGRATTLLELLARCGGATENASDSILVMPVSAQWPDVTGAENPGGPVGGKGEDEQVTSKQPAHEQRMTISLSRLLTGDPRMNIVLKDRDIVLFRPSRESREVVYILGDVDRRGPYPLQEEMNLALLFASIGLDPRDEKCSVTVTRSGSGGIRRQTFRAREVFEGKAGADFSLQDGDILTVDRVREVYYVIGQVGAPGGYVFQKGITVQEAIIMAGWITPRGDLDDINVIRKVGTEWKTQSIELNDEVLPGDILEVEERWF